MIRIIDSKYLISAVKPEHFPPTSFAEIAFCGKSNVGKSSMINTLLQRRMIAKTSSTPGKTKLINFFEIKFRFNEVNDGLFQIVDLPGYGYAKVSKTERESWRKMIGDFFEKRFQLRGTILLVDIRHDADPKDMMMIEMLRQSNAPFLICATKSDKIGKSQILPSLKKLSAEFNLRGELIQPFSSVKRNGVDEVLKWMEARIL